MLKNDFDFSMLKQLHIARDELRQQQALSPLIQHPAIREAIIRLLSNGLRTFCWLEKRIVGHSIRHER
jgi:hypothetical protein